MQAVQSLRKALPFVVSIGLLGYLLAGMELGPALASATPRTAVVLVTALAVFGFVSLWLEARCLCVLMPPEAELDMGSAMRVKCASYLVNIIHIALGFGAVAYLLRRRTGIGLLDAAGIVALISLLDLSLLLVIGAFGASAMASDAPALQLATLLGGVTAIACGFAVLRTQRSLGPLEALRQIDLFRAARSVKLSALLEVGVLRVVMVSSFMALFWISLIAFDITIPTAPVIVGIIGVTLISSLPIAIAGLGTGQAAFLYFFKDWADESTLLACSLALAIGLVALRGLMGLALAGEFTRDALAAARGEEP